MRTSTTSSPATRSAGPPSCAPPSCRSRWRRARTNSRSQVYRLLGCHGFARVDLMLADDDAELFVLETNAIPGFTETSLLPQAADAAGIDFDELISRILASAWTRERDSRDPSRAAHSSE